MPDHAAGLRGGFRFEYGVLNETDWLGRAGLLSSLEPCRAGAASAILVLDASGSMWGQIEGAAKIEIACRIASDLLATLPADQPLGLMVYGHRRKGGCSDIKTLALPAPGNRTAIAEAVAGLKPKGKTPMLDAVRQAAEALRYTEEKAIVILVSGGSSPATPPPAPPSPH
ncbi:VWA domain-containing protein [Ruegeria sp. WL0004]|uniref:VWA domain-containing protein n=1 Tax=Ruegeria marisflavi TaxID=2984152 RepID=A0ABT2WWQ0_9RHOB|nr:VWA domain-containing protein [Ruegeria sp. WL0004]MCU9840317.1 VWA domain-containing protein [Ruegeria sp. WL0004]